MKLRKLLTSLEAARILRRAPDTVRQMARCGRLRTALSTRSGRLYRQSDVERLAVELRQRDGAAR
jgi:hypothetical protein